MRSSPCCPSPSRASFPSPAVLTVCRHARKLADVVDEVQLFIPRTVDEAA